ncbi:hypothetical protein FKM82_009060 [Ascaphus truei]
MASSILERRFVPAFLTNVAWEGFNFAGHAIKIVEGIDLYGATVWPSALVLCYFLEKHGRQMYLEDKYIIEIGSGTGLVSIVACLLVLDSLCMTSACPVHLLVACSELYLPYASSLLDSSSLQKPVCHGFLFAWYNLP